MKYELGSARTEILPDGLILVVILLVSLCFVSGTSVLDVYSCEGTDIQLFTNIIFDNGSTVNIYINGFIQTLIGSWSFIGILHVLEEYKEQLFYEKNGTIWLKHIQPQNGGKYTLSYKTNGSDMKEQVHLHVMVAPTKNCKPKIQRKGFLLIPSLEDEFCGIPQAHVYWHNDHGSLKISDNVVKLDPANVVRTYSACAESPALKCVTMLQISDYCTNFTIERDYMPDLRSEFPCKNVKDKCQPVSSGSIEIHFMVIAGTCFYVLASVVVMSRLLYLRKKQPKMTDPKKKEVEEWLISEPFTYSKDPKHEAGDTTVDAQDRNYSGTKKAEGITLC